MSYEILYDRKFIRTTRGIIPMILSGSNNCTEFTYSGSGRSYERRERHWWAYIPRGMEIADHPENAYLIEMSRLTSSEGEPHEMFMSHGKWLMSNQWRKWFQNGCKSALSIEEYLKQNRHQSFYCEIRAYKTGSAYSESVDGAYVRSTAELEVWLDNANRKVMELNEQFSSDGGSAYICLSFSINEPLNAVRLATEGAVVAKNNACFVKEYITDKSLTFTVDPAEAAVFDSVEDAKAKLGYHWKNIRFVKAENQLKERNFVLKFMNGNLQGRYLQRKTNGRLYSTSYQEDAKRFETEQEAVRYAKATRNRFRIGDTITVVNLKNNIAKEVDLVEGNV